MKFQLISDLHLEHAKEYQLPFAEGEKEIVLFLAGDICEYDRLSVLFRFLKDVCARFKNVIYIAGNHEYYHGHIPNSRNKFLIRAKKDLPENFIFLHNEMIQLDGVSIIGTTLWTDYDKANPIAMSYGERNIADYDMIRFGNYERLRAIITVDEHKHAIEFLKKSFIEMEKKSIVVTHHAPCYKSINAYWAGNPGNPVFVSDLSELIYEGKPNFWLHGHMHNSFDYEIYDTRVICNPRGYPYTGTSRIENPEYDERKIMEI